MPNHRGERLTETRRKSWICEALLVVIGTGLFLGKPSCGYVFAFSEELIDVPVLDPFKTIGLGTLVGACVSPEGGRFFTTSGNGLQLWSMTGKLLSTPISGTRVEAEWSTDGSKIAAILGNGTCMILSKDGTLFYTTGSRTLPWGKASAEKIDIRWLAGDAVLVRTDGSRLRVWGLVSASLIGVVDTSTEHLTVWDAYWSHNFSYVAVSVPGENPLQIYDLDDWSPQKRMGDGQDILGAEWSNDDTRLAGIAFFPENWEAKVCIWDAASGGIVAERTVPVEARSPTWSQDDSLLAVDCFSWIRIYNTTSLDTLFSLGPLPHSLVSMSWLPDTSGLLTASRDGSVILWDISPRSPSQIWGTEESGISHARYSSDGALGLGLVNGTVRRISSPDLEEDFATGMVGVGRVTALDWSTSSGCLAVGHDSGLIAVWTSTGGVEGFWTGHPGGVLDLAWSSTGHELASVGDDGYLVTWDPTGVATGSRLLNDPVSLAWSPNAPMIVTSHRDGVARVWSFPGITLETSYSEVGCLRDLGWADISGQPGSGMIAGASDGEVLVWQVGDQDYRLELPHSGKVTDLSWSPAGLVLATSSTDGCVRIWDVDQHSAYQIEEIQGLVNTYSTGQELTTVDWSPDSRYIVTSSKANLLRLDLGGGKLLQLNVHSSAITGLSWSPDSTSIAFTTRPHEIGIYHRHQNTLNRFGFDDMSQMCYLTCLDWSPEGTKIAAGDLYGKIRVTDTKGDLLFTAHHHERISCLEWSPDSRYLASASWDRSIKIWDGDTGSPMLTLLGHTGWVSSLSWSPERMLLVSCSSQLPGEVRIWHLLRGECVSRFEKGHGSQIFDVAWSPDSASIAVTTFDTDGMESHLYLVDSHGNTIMDKSMTPIAHRVSWSPDAFYLVYNHAPQQAYQQSQVIVLSVSGDPICNLTGNAYLGEWSPDGTCIAAGGTGGVLKLYDTKPIDQCPRRIQPILFTMICLILMLGPKPDIPVKPTELG